MELQEIGIAHQDIQYREPLVRLEVLNSNKPVFPVKAEAKRSQSVD